MLREKVCAKVLAYYSKLLDPSNVSWFRELAGTFLAQSVPIDFERESLEVVALLLHFHEMKVCGYCRQLKLQSEFKSLGGRACTACQASHNRGHDRLWREQNRERRRIYMSRYMATYRSKKNTTVL